jgi:hypothetical protein
MGGDPDVRGVYGWGNLTTEPYSKTPDEYAVDVLYEFRFACPILSDVFQSDATLSNAHILRIRLPPSPANLFWVNVFLVYDLSLVPVGVAKNNPLRETMKHDPSCRA